MGWIPGLLMDSEDEYHPKARSEEGPGLLHNQDLDTHPLLPLQVDELAEVAASDVVHDDRQVVRGQKHLLRA